MRDRHVGINPVLIPQADDSTFAYSATSRVYSGRLSVPISLPVWGSSLQPNLVAIGAVPCPPMLLALADGAGRQQ
jgi:hypothetical protein